MSQLPAVLETIALPIRPKCKYPPSSLEDNSGLGPTLLGVSGTFGNLVLCFFIWQIGWWLAVPIEICLLFVAITWYQYNARSVISRRSEWAHYEQEVKFITDRSTERAAGAWLPILCWWETPRKDKITVIFLNGDERVVQEFPRKNVEKIHATIKAVRHPKARYSAKEAEAILDWGDTLWLYDPGFPLPISEQHSFPPDIASTFGSLAISDQTLKESLPQPPSVRDTLARLDAIIGNEAREESIPEAIETLENLAERVMEQPNLELEVRTLITLLGQVRSQRDSVQIITALRALREKIEAQASVSSAELEIVTMKPPSNGL